MNNAGIVHWEAAETVSPADWQKVIDVNLSGVFYGCQAVAKYMIRQQHHQHRLNVR
jgi:NAD(P)-dependent dehydrogenase (short-subunit alcohol dehydrogenase family)